MPEGVKKCSLERCNGQVVGWRLSRKHATCSSTCTTIAQTNKQTKCRAKAQHRAVALCVNEDGKCSRLVIQKKDHSGLCQACAKSAFTMKGDKIEAGGKTYCDHRYKICNKNGKGPLCADYNECLEPINVGKGKLGPVIMKWEKNGNVDCHRVAKDTANRVNYGTSGAMCSENY